MHVTFGALWLRSGRAATSAKPTLCRETNPTQLATTLCLGWSPAPDAQVALRFSNGAIECVPVGLAQDEQVNILYRARPRLARETRRPRAVDVGLVNSRHRCQRVCEHRRNAERPREHIGK